MVRSLGGGDRDPSVPDGAARYGTVRWCRLTLSNPS